MTDFKGKNNLPTIALGSERIKYKLNAFVEQEMFAEELEQVEDFNFAEKTFYGRVNRQLKPIIVDESFLLPLKTSSDTKSPLRVMNFVAEQFKDLELHFSKACRMGVIPVDDPILSSLKPKRAYENPLDLYKKAMNRDMAKFIQDNIQPRRKEVKDFDSFLRIFEESIMSMEPTPVLLSSFLKSKKSDIFVSGLAIDIGGISYSNDEEKQNKMFFSPAFEYYMNLAKQYGFSVNLHNPGVLISDLAHPITTEYRANFKLYSVDYTLRAQYKKANYLDLQLFTDLLLNMYNTFVDNNKLIKTDYLCNNKIKSNLLYLNYLNNININNILIKLYIKLYNKFEYNILNNNQLNIVMDTSCKMYKIDVQQTLDYIEEQFSTRINQKDGSLTYFLKRKNLI